MKKTLKWVNNILFTLILTLGISSMITIVHSKFNPESLPSIGGYRFMTVLSGSMSPVIEAGDIVVVKPFKHDDTNVNDVITFRDGSSSIVTHRIIDIVKSENETLFQTKGDANNISDQNLVSSEQVVGSLLFRIPNGGHVANFIKSTTGMISLAAILLISLLLGYISKSTSIRGNLQKGGDEYRR